VANFTVATAPLNEDTARNALGKSCALVLGHAGFEAASPTSNDMMVDLVARFFFKFGRVYRTYADTHSNSMPPEEILQRSLRQVGIGKIDILEGYWKVDVLHHGYRLDDIETKLWRKLKEMSFVSFFRLFLRGSGSLLFLFTFSFFLSFFLFSFVSFVSFVSLFLQRREFMTVMMRAISWMVTWIMMWL